MRSEKRLKKIKTQIYGDHQDPMNQTGQSTMYLANESVQHEMISKDNVRLKNSGSAMFSEKKSAKQGEEAKKKQDAIDIYKKIDDTFIEK